MRGAEFFIVCALLCRGNVRRTKKNSAPRAKFRLVKNGLQSVTTSYTAIANFAETVSAVLFKKRFKLTKSSVAGHRSDYKSSSSGHSVTTYLSSLCTSISFI